MDPTILLFFAFSLLLVFVSHNPALPQRRWRTPPLIWPPVVRLPSAQARLRRCASSSSSLAQSLKPPLPRCTCSLRLGLRLTVVAFFRRHNVRQTAASAFSPSLAPFSPVVDRPAAGALESSPSSSSSNWVIRCNRSTSDQAAASAWGADGVLVPVRRVWGCVAALDGNGIASLSLSHTDEIYRKVETSADFSLKLKANFIFLFFTTWHPDVHHRPGRSVDRNLPCSLLLL